MTKLPSIEVVAGAEAPHADAEAMRELGQTEFFPRKWEYAHKTQTLDDFMQPGFFCGEARSRLRLGDEIHYTLCNGSRLPSEWSRGIAVVEEIPSDRALPVVLAGYIRFSKPTPWRVVRAAGESTTAAEAA